MGLLSVSRFVEGAAAKTESERQAAPPPHLEFTAVPRHVPQQIHAQAAEIVPQPQKQFQATTEDLPLTRPSPPQKSTTVLVREVPVEKTIEVPEFREEIVVKRKHVPVYVDKSVPERVDIEVPVDVHRRIPVPVEQVTSVEFKLPKFRPTWKVENFPIYAPRFVEIPVPRDLLSSEVADRLTALCQRVRSVTSDPSMSLEEVERIAHEAANVQLPAEIDHGSFQEALTEALKRSVPALQSLNFPTAASLAALLSGA